MRHDEKLKGLDDAASVGVVVGQSLMSFDHLTRKNARDVAATRFDQPQSGIEGLWSGVGP